ncbi:MULTISPECIES: Hint domain-containing protein [Mameliella]|uniref:Hint domain-containing protein n=1 Tax=Mameliella TaxID=1434019 RepID=UPI000B52C954|nr:MULTISPECIES: Hint domain-containing protein [Mameliella]MCR9275096.1 Hint domain-containing protein [Paracoccaceae bacterium]OWV52706.1 hypothetical protein CDZ98_24845 [Mameliella alba]
MADLAADGVLTFTATDTGTTLSPLTGYVFTPSLATVNDSNNDDNIDSLDYYGLITTGYSGYTINIGGNYYAIFTNGLGEYYIPFDSAQEDLSALTLSAVTQAITQTGDDANVYNCFLTGTRIATPDGSRRIETLAHGDLILAADGRALPLRWLARMEVRPQAVNKPIGRLPIRIAAGALGSELPKRDLYVSPDHALVLDGMLVNASALINHSDIRMMRASEAPASFTYWHVELDAHEIILANGIPTESFVDYARRGGFDNYDEYLALNGCDRLIREMPLPRISSRRQLSPVQVA